MATDDGREYVEKLLADESFRDKLEKAKENLKRFSAGELATIHANVDAQQSRLTVAHLPGDGDDWTERLLRICLTLDIDPAEKSSGEIEALAMAWVDREKLKARIAFDVAESGRPAGKTDGKKKSWEKLPYNPDVIRLAKLIRDEPVEHRSKVDIAREFTEYDEKRAQSLLRKLRDFPHLLN